MGAGAFGGWTALYLREMGFGVTMVDQYGPGNSRATSGGESRQIRAGYREREIYKHGIMLGDYVARRVVGKDTHPELARVFNLKDRLF